MILNKIEAAKRFLLKELLNITDKIVTKDLINQHKVKNNNPEVYLKLWKKEKKEQYPQIDKFEERMGFAIDPEWFHKLALLTQIVIKKSKPCYQHGRLLYASLRSYIEKNKSNYINILETGTARGFSALCMARALDDAGVCGKLITIDILPNNVPMYWNCIADEKGPMTRMELIKDYRHLIDKYIIFVQGYTNVLVDKIDLSRIHFAFIDGGHDYNTVMNDFKFLIGKQKKGDIIFFDDYTPALFPGVVRAVDTICNRYGYEKEIITVSNQRGYAITTKL